jgi:ABC-type transporter Mla subunit MlaD
MFIRCAILKKFTIHRDALIEIQQSGFLGDQYISITPTLNEGAVLEDGAKMDVAAPFNMIEAARKASGLMQRLDATAAKLDSAITRVDRVLLAEPVLRDLTNAFGNFNRISERADAAIAEVQSLVATNSPAVGITLSNLNAFTITLRDTATNISGVVDANKASVQTTLNNLASASDDLKQLSGDLRSGQGVVGALFKDAGMRTQVEGIVQNMGTVSSNLSRFGLLWKPKTTKPLTNDFRYPGRSPFR